VGIGKISHVVMARIFLISIPDLAAGSFCHSHGSKEVSVIVGCSELLLHKKRFQIEHLSMWNLIDTSNM